MGNLMKSAIFVTLLFVFSNSMRLNIGLKKDVAGTLDKAEKIKKLVDPVISPDTKTGAEALKPAETSPPVDPTTPIVHPPVNPPHPDPITDPTKFPHPITEMEKLDDVVAQITDLRMEAGEMHSTLKKVLRFARFMKNRMEEDEEEDDDDDEDDKDDEDDEN